MQIHPSVLSDGFSPQAIYSAVNNAHVTTHIGNEPTRLLVLGDDDDGDMLEITTIVRSEDILVLHARKAREKYQRLVEEASELLAGWKRATGLSTSTQYGRSSDGLDLDDPLIRDLFERAEKGYDVPRLMTRTRPGRPAPLTVEGVVRVGLDSDLAERTNARAQELAEDKGTLLVRALEEYLEADPSPDTNS